MDTTSTHTIIAIDGPSSSGKSTLAKNLAQKLKYLYIDTGAMYRAVALYCIQQDIKPNNLTKSDLESISIQLHMKNDSLSVYLNNIDVSQKIRSLEVSEIVSDVAALPIVRNRLVLLQREIANGQNVVMDGRDIGSVVFPNASYKFFVTAALDTRAKRRYDEMVRKADKCVPPAYDEVKNNLSKRDHIDSTRLHSPLVECADAYHIDNTTLSPEQQLQVVLEIIED